MAKSSNRRKNGKTAKADLRKRINKSLQHELRNLRIVSVVDRVEIDGTSRTKPRTYVWDVKKNREVSLTTNQQFAIHNLSWKWDVYTGIVCRDFETGEVKITDEDGFICSQAYKQTDLSNELADRLCDAFIGCKGNSLTMVWVMSPLEMETELNVDVILYGLWKWNILGNMLTENEQKDEGKLVRHFRTDTFKDFKEWWVDQERYMEIGNQNKVVTFEFSGTGLKPLPKELIAYRDELKRIFTKDLLIFNPRATVKGFMKDGAMKDVTVSGEVCSLLMTAFDNIPQCLDVYVEVKYESGEVNKIKFFGEKK